MKQSSAMSDERPADDAALIERAWVALKERCCAKPVEAKRCVMVSRADFAAALNAELSELRALVREQHKAMGDVMALRRLSESQATRDKAEGAIAVWRKVEAFLGGDHG